jgi:hypothetical protein
MNALLAPMAAAADPAAGAGRGDAAAGARHDHRSGGCLARGHPYR